MRRILSVCRSIAAAVCFVALALPARADVMLDPHLSGTGDNVVFDSITGSLVLGHLNGPHLDVVRFIDLSGNPNFSGSANGNDIKIVNTNDMSVQVFDPSDTSVEGTATQVFSAKGTGDLHLAVTATDGVFNFDLGVLDPSAQSGFTLTATNGETMSKLVLLDVGGEISDFEHYRIDVAPLAVPGPVAGGGLGGLLAGLFGLGLAWRRTGRPGRGRLLPSPV